MPDRVNITEIRMHPTPPFHFVATVYSHGWVMLAPNSWDPETGTLQRIQSLNSGETVRLQISGSKDWQQPVIDIRVHHVGELSGESIAEIERMAGHMVRLDEDFTGFYALCREKGERWSQVAHGMGRLLRSPGLFEDIVKTICTTNIQWGGTKRMVSEIVSRFGRPLIQDHGHKSFPEPQDLSSVSQEEFIQQVNLGYRAPYIYELSRRIASGDIELNSFFDAKISTTELKNKLLRIKGVGNYAAATLLMILGRYDELPLDTVFREHVSKRYFENRVVPDQEARSVYDGWDQWKYLAYWFDLWEGTAEQL